MASQIKKSKYGLQLTIIVENSSVEKEKNLISRLSLKEGNQRIEKNRKQVEKLQHSDRNHHIKDKLVHSPIMADTFEEEAFPIHSIKSNVHYASGHKFDSSNSKIILVKNLKRNGDFNEGIREITSSSSKADLSPRHHDSPNKDKSKYLNNKNKLAKYSPSNGLSEYFQMCKPPHEESKRKPENELRMKLDFNQLSAPIKSARETEPYTHKVVPLNKNGFSNRASPLLNSSRQNTERKEELESQTLEIIALIRNSFNTLKKAPVTQTSFYKIGRVLGKGAFGKVNLAMHLLAKRLGKYSFIYTINA